MRGEGFVRRSQLPLCIFKLSVALGQFLRVGFQFRLFFFQRVDLALGLLQGGAGLPLLLFGRRKPFAGRIEPRLRVAHFLVELFHAEQGDAHVFRGRRQHCEGQRRDQDAGDDGNDD